MIPMNIAYTNMLCTVPAFSLDDCVYYCAHVLAIWIFCPSPKQKNTWFQCDSTGLAGALT